MRMFDAAHGAFARIARLIATLRRTPELACGDCERWERCGLPPNDRCIVRAAQIARDGGMPIRRATPFLG